MKTSEILTKAAEVMMELGHAKGRLMDAEGRVCIEGACQLVINQTGDMTIPYDRAFGPIRQVIGESCLYIWNDHEETTEAMALGALHEAAILAKEQGD